MPSGQEEQKSPLENKFSALEGEAQRAHFNLQDTGDRSQSKAVMEKLTTLKTEVEEGDDEGKEELLKKIDQKINGIKIDFMTY
ncbi:MAG: hypothetical protein CMI52_04200 [Parcubacteria group bacterium]|nr:hypothetical protein [Parcubacteria group bacterium]